MNRLRVAYGALWMLWPLVLIGIVVSNLAVSHFDYWPRYIPFIALLLLAAVCGFYFFCSLPGSRWVLAVAALIASLYFAFWVLAVGLPGPSGLFEVRNAILPLGLAPISPDTR